MDLYSWSQLAALSPSQCPAHFPLDGYVDLVTTMPLLPVTSNRALQGRGETQEFVLHMEITQRHT